jgi:hypothetical protein
MTWIGLAPEDAAYRALWWNLRGMYWYLQSNAQYLVNYGWRYQRGMPISSSIAESAVNEVVSLRCAKKRQMHWTNKGAHLLVQVRVAVLNGELKMRDMPDRRLSSKEKRRTIIANAWPSRSLAVPPVLTALMLQTGRTPDLTLAPRCSNRPLVSTESNDQIGRAGNSVLSVLWR